MNLLSALILLAGCGGPPTYIVEGVIREVPRPAEIVVQHEPIAGLMDAMIMPFEVDADAAGGVELRPGDRIFARLEVDGTHWHLTKIRVTGHDPSLEAPIGPGPIRPGGQLPGADLPVSGGTAPAAGVSGGTAPAAGVSGGTAPAVGVNGGTPAIWRVGEGQAKPTLLTFLYTTCPLPTFCPATTRRLQELQAQVRGEAHLVAVTIDPEHDTAEVLERYAAAVGAEPDTWRFTRPDRATLEALAASAALSIVPGTGPIEHNTRFLVLDAKGKLIERYDDSRFPADRVVEQLRTGGPPAPPDSDGTMTP